jgi:hypothetical protein
LVAPSCHVRGEYDSCDFEVDTTRAGMPKSFGGFSRGGWWMRRGEVLATKWCDIDFDKNTLNIRKSIWQQHVGPVKTGESEKVMPLDDEMIADLLR